MCQIEQLTKGGDMQMTIRMLDKITATLNPKVTDDLVAGMENHIGKYHGNNP